jgi:polyhydroxyalkanoate synthesis regulator phasin
MADFFEKTMLAGLGALHVTKEQLEKWVEELVEKGKVTRDEAPKMMKDLLSKADENRKALETRINSGIENALTKVNLATKKDVDALNAKLDLILKEMKKRP